jgi:hypothetical protein
MAAIRKHGMDVLSPQDLHDNVLACVFVSLSEFSEMAHKGKLIF